MTKQFDDLYEQCLGGKVINVESFDLTEENASHLMGKAKEYTREGEFFEVHESNVRAAKGAYKRAERLEKFAASIRAKLST